MTTQTAIPKLGYLLRVLVKVAGYRCFIESKKLDKDLDDLVIEARPSVASDLLIAIEEACCHELEIDCGTDWAGNPPIFEAA